MSEPIRIALVAEGPLDRIIIEAALNAFSPDYTLTCLQPEHTRPVFGNGWGGVLKWCHSISKIKTDTFDKSPILSCFDILIIHIDGDVHSFKYSDCGESIDQLAESSGWYPLPCGDINKSPQDNCENVILAVKSWLGIKSVGSKTVFCVPAMSTGTWLAVAVFPESHSVFSDGIENVIGLEIRLECLPLRERIKKSQREYSVKSHTITSNWNTVISLCSRAAIFQSTFRSTLKCTDQS